MSRASDNPLIQGLLRPEAYDHPVSDIEVVETHISWVLLTGDFAYKLKKPLELGFLDFSTLQKRRFFCEEELRLNRRLAPSLYLDVVPVTRNSRGFRVNGSGDAVEYAVRMKQFPADARLDQRINQITPESMILLARDIASFHQEVEVAPADSPFGSLERVTDDMADNFDQIESRLTEGHVVALTRALRTWHRKEIDRLGALIERRKAHGFVRECHGDLHLTNLISLNDRIIPFDCIEFNPALRFVDVISEVGFLAMDLMLRERGDLSLAFVAHYLEASGDYEGVRLLRLFMVYRSLVRAKVAAIRHAQDGDPGQFNRSRDHVVLAETLTRPPRPLLVLMHGLSGSGKTWLSEQMIPALPALRVRSDVERKRLFGESSGSNAPGADIYTPEHTRATYESLEQATRDVLESRFSIIVDAAFLKRTERERFRRVAEECEADFRVLECTAPVEVLRQRITDRAARGADVSDADLRVLDFQIDHAEGLTDDERPWTVTVNTEEVGECSRLAGRLRDPTVR